VVVSARMTNDARDYLNEQTKFWVVKPRIGLGGITGLTTLLSGSYIEMDSVPGGVPLRKFVGLERPPLTPEGAPGIRLLLRAAEAGSLDAGSPVYYRRIKVGRVEGRRLAPDGSYVEIEIFVDAPYHRLITTNTRFWNASGFDVTIGADGIEVHSETLETIVFGGVAFSNPPRLYEGSPVESDAVFTLYENQADAESQPAEGAIELYGFVLYFDESVRGLKVGAPVEYLGVKVGYVADVSIEFNPREDRVEVPVLIFLEWGRIRGISAAEDLEDRLAETVFEGLRARLQSGNLLTSQLVVELTVVPDATPAAIVETDGYPVFPTVPSAFTQIADNASNFLATLSALPLDELVESATRLIEDAGTLVRAPPSSGPGSPEAAEIEQAPLRQLVDTMTRALAGIDAIVNSREAQRLPADLARALVRLNQTLKAAGEVLEGDATVSPLYYELSTALQELTRAARAVRVLTETLEDKPNALIFGR
jgi:paraquat-inducible protein B